MENNLTRYEIGTCRFCGQSMALAKVCGSWEEAENAATAACKCEGGKEFRRAAQEKATIQEIFGKDDPEAQQLICTLAEAVREGYILGAANAAVEGPMLPEADSELERQYYATVLWPKVVANQVAQVELHKRFSLYPADTYCGLKLPAAHYTPDFVVTYANGFVEVVEVKSAAIRKLQRDYIYRRRLFIELIARPNGWGFTEYIQE